MTVINLTHLREKMADWSSFRVEQLKNYLLSLGYPEDSLKEIKGKAAYVEFLKSIDKSPSDIAFAGETMPRLDDIEPEERIETKSPQKEENPPADTPAYTSPDWHGYVMTHFAKGELIDGHPKAAGLRRVAELLLGNIIKSGPVQVFPPTRDDGPGRATVHYEITFKWKLNESPYVDESMMQTRIFGDAADVYRGNGTGDVFALHPVATATTRAESRCLRKALNLQTISYEETTENNPSEIIEDDKMRSEVARQLADWTGEPLLTDNQKVGLEVACKTCGIDLMKFINKNFYLGLTDKAAFDSVDLVPRRVATAMMQELMKYQTSGTGSQDIPKELLI